MARRNLKFLLYSIHAHVETGNPDYMELLRTLVALKGRVTEEGKKFTVVGPTSFAGSRLNLTIYSGEKDKTILLFDLQEKTEVTTPTAGRFPAKKTHIMLDANQRLALIESGRGHVSPEDLEKLIEEFAREMAEYSTLDVSFAPVAAKKFVEEIDLMERIQQASVSIARPNVDWTENYNSLTHLADESQGKIIDTTIRAKRGASLSKDKGLIPNLKKWLSDKTSSVSSARIRGQKESSSGLTLLNLKDYVESATIPVDTKADTGQVIDSGVQRELGEFLDKKAKETNA